ncbi:hypothetical protein CQJ94_12715 [Glycomyces fuscus]|nr:hypothetical protein CQJ94_12715 [Glycomyces fuscus]
MRRPALPLPLLADDAASVSGMLLVRADHDDEAWDDVCSRLGELPGLVVSGPGHQAPAALEEPVPRRLILVDDPAWRGATPEEVSEALTRDGVWVPGLVLLVDDRTAANTRLRPLLAFRGTGGDTFRITPRQAALTHLVLHRPYLDLTLQCFEEWAPAEPGWEPDEDVEEWESELPEPVGAHLESLDPPPRYEPPVRALPLLTQENAGLLVRTDFSDDAAWASLLGALHRPGPGYGDPIDDFGDYIETVDDPVFGGATPEQLMASVRVSPEDPDQMIADVVLVADRASMRDPEHRLLAVPLEDRVGWAFRITPEMAGTMVVNLAVGNQGLEDYTDVEPEARL